MPRSRVLDSGESCGDLTAGETAFFTITSEVTGRRQVASASVNGVNRRSRSPICYTAVCELDMDLKLKWEGNTGDGKRAFVVAASNDGWRDLRIEVDTDDCDSEFAKAAMQEVIDRVNAANGE